MITAFKAGEHVASFFVLRKKEIKAKYDSDEVFLQLELADASGHMKAAMREDVHETFDLLTPGDVVKIKGRVVSLKNRLHLNIEKIRQAKEEDHYDLKQLVPVVDKDIDELFSQLDQFIAGVSNPFLHKLLELVFNDPDLREKFGKAPAGKLWHHNYLGGLLEHTLSVTQIASEVGKMYPDINQDLLIAAGLLHDIGKIETYIFKTFFDFTDEGRLVGHIVLGAQLVAGKIKLIVDFPKKLETELTHLILSHQGKLEHASPVVPMTLEGLILYYADELDSNANAFLRIKKKEKMPGKQWSSYINLLGRYLYFGGHEE